MTRILLLGGTTEAGRIARALAEAGADAVFSYAGRTAAPAAPPLPLRVGGFGGAEGLAAWLCAERISHVIDATHPFAATISRNAQAACAATGARLIACARPAWREVPGDRWIHVPDIAGAAAALPEQPARVFLAIGRMHLAGFAGRPQHHYLLRLVDPPAAALPLPRTQVVLARGPFTQEADLALLREARIGIVVAKNSGGEGARAKLDAARTLGLPVVMIARPCSPARETADSVEAVMRWLHQTARLGV